MLLTSLILCSTLIVANARIQFTRESYTLKGKPCVTDCIDSHCIINKHKQVDRCKVGKSIAWVYHNFQTHAQSRSKFCLSNCGHFGEKYNWCFVSETQWDYCNPDKNIHVEHDKVLTASGVQCVTACKKLNNNFECKNIWGRYEKCVDAPVSYVVSETRSGAKCPGTCRKVGSNDYHSSCFVAHGQRENCAAPARNYHKLRSAMRELYTRVHHRRTSPRDRTSFTRNYIRSLKYTKGLIYHNVKSHHNSIYAYAMMPAFYYDEPFLPLYVKARITKNNIPPPNSRTPFNSITRASVWNVRLMGKVEKRRQNNDGNGHLIAYQLGGPPDVYNFAAQTEYLNKGIPTGKDTFTASPWYNFENDIKDVVKRRGGYVELTIAVIYDDNFINNPRPRGFAVTQQRFNTRRKNYYSVYDSYYSNYPADGLFG